VPEIEEMNTGVQFGRNKAEDGRLFFYFKRTDDVCVNKVNPKHRDYTIRDSNTIRAGSALSVT
jgi:hypothetical protein